MAIDGAARGVIMGVAWGMCFDAGPQIMLQSERAASPEVIGRGPLTTAASKILGQHGAEAFSFRANIIARSALSFGGFLFVYNGISCQFEHMRNSKDAFNNFAGGAAAGALFSIPSKSPRLIATTAGMTGLMTGAVSFMFGNFKSYSQ